ncbi:MAG TPA: hypothetical protein VNT99_18550 [Methylomirabilota bacterium]|nr:hypothetical protein [Methylomirabilota bacterium]
MWPVILRELRANSRRWTTYWLRLLAAAAVLLTIFLWFETTRSMARQPGSQVFVYMHRVVLAIVWVLVPLMMCDCISSERREGTLGLLFLTNLRARQIVCAKAFVHLLQALTLWAAIIPIIVVPLLLGGLSWKEILFSFGWTLGSLCLAAAAGIAASAASSNRTRAVISAMCLSGGFFLVFAALGCGALALAVARYFPVPGQVATVDQWIEMGAALLFGINEAWTEVFSGTTPLFQNAAVLATFAVALVCLLLLLAVIALAAFQIRRNWQDKPKTTRQTQMEHVFYSPMFLKGLFRRWMRWSLERNPIGWLEKRSWLGRIAALIWLSVMISFASAAASYATVFSGGGLSMLNALMWMLLISIAYVAAGSFRRERETGALELILVSPLREREIILGRLRGIWSQFLPAFAVWAAVIIYLYSWNNQWEPGVLLHFAVIYLIIPVVGLYFSLRTRAVLVAWAATLVLTFGLPQLIGTVLYRTIGFVFRSGYDPDLFPGWAKGTYWSTWFVIPLIIGASLFWRLEVNLRRRSFSLQ